MKGKYARAFQAAFPYTTPIFAGFWFLGLTYGIYMNVSGFSFWYPMLMSLTILPDRWSSSRWICFWAHLILFRRLS